MITLNPDECRVLGVLVEKALTTPDQYPLSLNAIVNGANQKNNRDPVIAMAEMQALDAVNGLRTKGLLVQVDAAGSRVSRYRYSVENLGVNTRELVVLAELLLRGPQTGGELRGRASRMYPLESLELVQSVLDQLLGRPEPLVQRLAPLPGSRAERYAQLLCLDLHPLGAPAAAQAGAVATSSGTSLAQRVEAMEADMALLKKAIRHMAEQLGEPDPLGPDEVAKL